jgi:sugar/nucleoside kinase (ribokinase family)
MFEQSDRLSYRLIGHVTRDLTPEGARLGGTVTYSGLTAVALGAEVGILTACAHDLELEALTGMEVIRVPSPENTTFTNQELKSGRTQLLQSRAGTLSSEMIPPVWRDADIIHLAPIADEIEPNSLDTFSPGSICMTPQGWLRKWDGYGRVGYKSWHAIGDQLAAARAVVCSIEDLGGSLDEAEKLALRSSCLVVTHGNQGALLFVDGEKTEIRPIAVDQVDPTGAGDIFATVFFTQLCLGSDPRTAAERANYLAARSVTRRGLQAIPTQFEIDTARERH